MAVPVSIGPVEVPAVNGVVDGFDLGDAHARVAEAALVRVKCAVSCGVPYCFCLAIECIDICGSPYYQVHDDLLLDLGWILGG